MTIAISCDSSCNDHKPFIRLLTEQYSFIVFWSCRKSISTHIFIFLFCTVQLQTP